jgi:hypothetical protein
MGPAIERRRQNHQRGGTRTHFRGGNSLRKAFELDGHASAGLPKGHITVRRRLSVEFPLKTGGRAQLACVNCGGPVVVNGLRIELLAGHLCNERIWISYASA